MEQRKRFMICEISQVHIDEGELRYAKGRLSRSLAINRITEVAHVEAHDYAGKPARPDRLRNIVLAVPCGSPPDISLARTSAASALGRASSSG